MKAKGLVRFLVLIILAAAFPGACRTVPPPVMPVPEQEYLLGSEDVIEVTVWKEEDLSKEVIIRPDGKISLPLIGDIRAAGITAEALGANITQALTDFLDGPTVNVNVLEINSLKIFIQGEVAQPGVYDLKSNYTVLQALTLAGGFTEWAKKDDILIFRKGEGGVESIPVNYEKIISGKAPEKNIFLKRGDTIVVP